MYYWGNQRVCWPLSQIIGGLAPLANPLPMPMYLLCDRRSTFMQCQSNILSRNMLMTICLFICFFVVYGNYTCILDTTYNTLVFCYFSLSVLVYIYSKMKGGYTSIQMKCQGGVIFVHACRLFYCPKRRIGYARCSLTGNKNYRAITKLTNSM